MNYHSPSITTVKQLRQMYCVFISTEANPIGCMLLSMHNFDVIFLCFTYAIFHIKKSKEKRKEREKDENIMNFSDKHIPQVQHNGKTMGPKHQQPSPTGKKNKI